jgi:L-malate glycosyltransferase
MKNKNILELCLAPGLGGLEMFVASCYEEFSKKTICKVAVAPGSKLDNYFDLDDKFHTKRNKFFPIFPAFKLAKYIDENEIDVLHFHWTRDMITAVLAKVFSNRKPKLIQSRHMGMTRFKDDLYHKWLYKNIDMIHAVTLEVKAQLKKFIPQDVRPQLEMVYLGTQVSSIDEKKVALLKQQYNLNDQFVVGIVGRIEKPKGQYQVIEAVAKLKEFNIKAIVVGSAMEENYLEELKFKIKELEIEDKVIFIGFTKDVAEHMQLFDVNVLATEHETFGLVVIEAMANRVAMIATNKGGPLEIIKNGVDGLLYDGTSEDLAKKIESLVKDETLRLILVENGFQTVQKRFDKQKQLVELYDVIEKI